MEQSARAGGWMASLACGRVTGRSQTARVTALLDESKIGLLFLGRWEPTLVLDQAAQIFDLARMARVAVDNTGKPDA